MARQTINMDERTSARTKEVADNEWLNELKKVRESPFYFATTYILINGKPFETCLPESEFNTQANANQSKDQS